MRPTELVIEGFRSYAERSVFGWRDRRLVGIVGPIGSGKSSILDAIAFALYGKTPVFERDRVTLINQRRDQARVELAFEVDGDEYRALRVLRRKGRSRHALQRYEAPGLDHRKVKPVEVFEGDTEVNRRVAELIGLDFHAFCRSVLLPQNRFADFLRAPPAERDQVLKGVFGLERVDVMHAAAKGRRRQAELTLRELEGRLATVAEDEQALVAAREQLTASACRAEALERAAPRVAELDGARQHAAATLGEARATLVTLGEAREQLPSTAEVEQAAEAAQSQRLGLEAARGALELARAERQAAAVALEQTAARVGSAEALARAASAVEALEQAEARRVELGAAAEAARRELGAADEAAGRADEQAKLAEASSAAAHEASDRAEARLGEARRRLEANERPALARAQQLHERLTRELEQLAEQQRELEQRTLAQQAAARLVERAEQRLGQLVAAQTAAERAEADAGKALEVAEAQLVAARDADMAQALRRGLTVGEPCPVCEHPVSTLPASGGAGAQGLPLEVVAGALAEAESARQAAATARAARVGELTVAGAASAAAEQALVGARGALSTAEGERAGQAERLAAQQRVADEARVALVTQIGEGEPRARLAELAEQVEAAEAALAHRAEGLRVQQAVLGQADAELAAAREQQLANQRARQQAALAAERADTELASLGRSTEAARGELARLPNVGEPDTPVAEVRARIEAARGELEAARARRDGALLAAEAAVLAHEQAQAAEQQRQQRERALLERLSALAGQLRLILGAALEEERQAQAQAALPLFADDHLRQRAAQLAEGIAAEEQAQRERERQALVAEQEAREQLVGELERLSVLVVEQADRASFERALAAAREARGADEARVEALAQRLALARELTEQRDAAAARGALYEQLQNDLTSSRFLKYLLDEERAALSALGSARFETLSGGRYRFTGDGSFAVLDLANAETERKTDTLSGGELFLASLALALALAEQVARGGGRLDAFFLDEGFGSLDPEHLELALDGIERLVLEREAGRRLVAVVSHVAELRQRVEDLLELDRDPLTGDTIVVRGASADG